MSSSARSPTKFDAAMAIHLDCNEMKCTDSLPGQGVRDELEGNIKRHLAV
jgi:hypothetical protein